MKTTVTLSILAIVCTLGAAPLGAHHAFASEFDNTQPLLMTGKFVGMDWVNPHSWVHFEVTMPDGSVELWSAETPPVNALIRQGWTRDAIQMGDEIQVNGAAAKNGSHRMWASQVRIVSQGGQRLQEPRTVLSMFSLNPDGVPEGLLPVVE